MRIKFIAFSILLFFGSGAFAFTEINLSGTWEYCIIKSGNDYPPDEKKVWSKIQLPNRDLFSLIAEKNGITRGYILYRKTVQIYSKPSEQLVFQAGEIMNSDIVYFNGRKIGQTGMFPPEFKSGWSKFRHYPIPDEYIKPGENRIEIINYFDAELWFISPVRITGEKHGNREYMFRNFIQIEFIHAFCIVLLCFSLFFIGIFIGRKKEIMYLYYSAATFFLADMMILQFVENNYTYLPLSSNTIYKICGIGPMFYPPFLAFFFRSYLELKVSFKRIAVYLFPSFLCMAFMLISQDRYYIIYWRNIFLLLIPLYIADIVIVSTREIIAGNRKGLMLFISLLPIFIFGIYDILVFKLHAFEGGVPLYPLGVPFIAVLISLQLINRFIHNLNTSEKLNILLQQKIEEGKRLAALDNEISIAKKIQLANIPQALPELKTFSIGVKYLPAENISGDFYNFHAFEHEKLGVLIADASGHGIPASLISSMVKILFSTLKPVYSDPEMFIMGLNRYLYDKMDGNFLTAGYCFIDRTEKKGLFSRAGHEPLLHISHKDSVTMLFEYSPQGKLIGLNSEIDVALYEFDIYPGDRLILYTDGLIEVFNETGEIFGRDRLKNLLMESKELSADGSIDYIFNELNRWRPSHTFEDDFTLIIIDVL